MANRKEDEKNEKIIRGLLKLPENRRCINCNSLGPQYVCTNFWTFVCTNCSGIHREFTHRVKSISMAKFTSQEVMSLKQGGNQRAKEIFLKNWDSQRQSFPDNSNVDRLRTFIKHVYVDRRYSGERNYDKPPRGEKEEAYDNRRTDQGGSRSPPYEEVFERRFSGRSSPGGRSDDRSSRYSYDERRSPGYDQDRKSPARPEVVNDWRREDRFGNARRTEDRRISDADVRSPERQKSLNVSSPPEVRPVRDILGENVVPLCVNEPPKPSGGRIGDGPAPTQRTASSSSLGSTSGNPVEVKLESSKSLIDFDAEPEPPASVAPQAPQTTTDQSVAQPPASSSDNNWASFDFAPQVNTSQPPTGVNPLDSVLSELSVPASVPGGAGSPTVNSMGNFGMLTNSGGSSVGHLGNTTTLPPSAGATAASPRGNSPTFFPAGAPVAAHGQTPVHPHVGGGAPTSVSTRGQQPILQHQPPSPHAVFGSQPNQAAPMGSIAANNQTLNMSVSQNAQGPLGSAALQTSQAVSRPGQDVSVSSGVGSQPPLEVTPTGRRALPEDLFTVPPYAAPFPAWQTGPPRAMGFTMQYNPVMQMPTFQPTSRSINPFDVNNEPAPTQAPVFPSMTSLQNALPNVPPQSGLLQTSGFGTPSPALGTPQAPPYIPGMPPQVQSFPSAMPPRPYMGQQPTSNMPFSSQQQQGGMGSEGDAFGSFNMDQQFGGGFLRPPNLNPSSSAGGNPFG